MAKMMKSYRMETSDLNVIEEISNQLGISETDVIRLALFAFCELDLPVTLEERLEIAGTNEWAHISGINGLKGVLLKACVKDDLSRVVREAIIKRSEKTIIKEIVDGRSLFEMGELLAFLGDYSESFDIDAIVDKATEIDPATGNRYWLPGINLSEICMRHDKDVEIFVL